MSSTTTASSSIEDVSLFTSTATTSTTTPKSKGILVRCDTSVCLCMCTKTFCVPQFIAPVARRELTPLIALAFELKQLGFRVGICAPDTCEQMIKAFDLFEAVYALRWPVDELARTLAYKKAHFEGLLVDQSQVDLVATVFRSFFFSARVYLNFHAFT